MKLADFENVFVSLVRYPSIPSQCFYKEKLRVDNSEQQFCISENGTNGTFGKVDQQFYHKRVFLFILQ